ncbi:MAG: hypothetical protein Q8929_13910 [Bacillota bacterium]|nr:hypothetical protein [Bacillota bacterium]
MEKLEDGGKKEFIPNSEKTKGDGVKNTEFIPNSRKTKEDGEKNTEIIPNYWKTREDREKNAKSSRTPGIKWEHEHKRKQLITL